MPALTTEEQRLFGSSQLTQVNRLSATRRDEYLTPGQADEGAFRAFILAKFAKLTASQMRARVNIVKVAWSATPVITYSPESDYTVAEQEAIARGLRSGDKWPVKVANIVDTGPDLEQRVRTLEAR